MPIEFRCVNCQKLLRTPDESAGKKAKCPQCASIVDVPGTSDANVEPTLPTQASPFGSNADIGSVHPPAIENNVNPYAAPSAQAFAPYGMPTSQPTAPGLPWEREGKSLKTFLETVKLVFSKPTDAFRMMKQDESVGDPISFIIIGSLIGGLFSAIYMIAFQSVALLGLAGNMGRNEGIGAGLLVQAGLQFGMAIIGGTLGAVIQMFISGGIYHICLLIVRGANGTYITTSRVVAYVGGSMALLQLIPLCGAYGAGLAAIVYSIIGIAAAHRISGGKATLAVLLPILFCGGLFIIVFATIFGFAAANGGFR